MAQSSLPTAFLELKPLPGKGKGFIAKCRIPAGTRLTLERPLISTAITPGELDPVDIYEAFSALSTEQKKTYLTLHAAPNQVNQALDLIDEDLDEIGGAGLRAEIARVTAIFMTNSFEMWEQRKGGGPADAVASTAVGIFPLAARFNHSCTPNVAQTWNEAVHALTVHAIRDIETGEELCDSYCKLGLPAKERKATLSERYGFDCICDACDQSREGWREHETRRERICRLESDLWAFRNRTATSRARAAVGSKLVSTTPMKDPPVGEWLDQLIGLLREEGLIGHDLLQWCTYYGEYSLHRGQASKTALRIAGEAHELAVVIEGNDHRHVQRCRIISASLQQRIQ